MIYNPALQNSEKRAKPQTNQVQVSENRIEQANTDKKRKLQETGKAKNHGDGTYSGLIGLLLNKKLIKNKKFYRPTDPLFFRHVTGNTGIFLAL